MSLLGVLLGEACVACGSHVGSSVATATARMRTGCEGDERVLADRAAEDGLVTSNSAALARPATTGQWGVFDDGPLSPAESARVIQGLTVSRPLEFRHAGGSYIGGVAHQLVRAEVDQILETLLDVDQIPSALPLTHDARLVEQSAGALAVELVQGNALVRARYTICILRTEDNLVRFWLDKQRPHDIRDAWGYFRAIGFSEGQSLVTVAVALDLGSPLTRALLEKRVQRVALSSPAHLRDYLEPQNVSHSEGSVPSRVSE